MMITQPPTLPCCAGGGATEAGLSSVNFLKSKMALKLLLNMSLVSHLELQRLCLAR